MSILTDRCTIKIFYRGKSNGENKRVTVKNVRSVMGTIKQSVLKQVKTGGGGEGEGIGEGKILYCKEGRYNNHCNNRIVLSFLRDIINYYYYYY